MGYQSRIGKKKKIFRFPSLHLIRGLSCLSTSLFLLPTDKMESLQLWLIALTEMTMRPRAKSRAMQSMNTKRRRGKRKKEERKKKTKERQKERKKERKKETEKR